MSDSEKGKKGEVGGCGSVEGGFTIVMDEQRVESFMQAGDFSSSIELHHFESIAGRIEDIVKGGKRSILACSLPEDRAVRDFAVLQIAHILSKRDRKILIVDCDFLSPGLSGIVDDTEEHGFLDLLLYGSSIKSISKDIGIEGVDVIGPGSFPVAKTIPFAMKEFGKINAFLAEKSDLVFYCSTVYTEDGKLNPMCREVDQTLLFCQIDRLEEGELKGLIDSFKDEGVACVEIVYFCREGEEEVEAVSAREEQGVEEKEEVAGEAGYIEKTSDVVVEVEEGHSRLPWIITSVIGVLIVVFITWWFLNYQAVKQNEAKQRLTEVVQKKTESRSAAMERKGEEAQVVLDTTEKALDAEKPLPVSASESVEAGAESTIVSESSAIENQGFYYAVHVASFQDVDRAGREVDYLKKNGFDAFVVKAVVRGKTWLRVMVGRFATKEEADRAKLDLLELRRIGYARVVKQRIGK